VSAEVIVFGGDGGERANGGMESLGSTPIFPRRPYYPSGRCYWEGRSFCEFPERFVLISEGWKAYKLLLVADLHSEYGEHAERREDLTMKNILLKISIICGLLIAGSVGAQITGIISGVSSGAVYFADSSSFNPSAIPGSNYSQYSAPWNGSPVSLSQTDPTTLDSASGILDASGFGGFNYPIVLNNVTLSQPSVNTGHADLTFSLSISYTLGASGLPSALVQFPNFLVSGTVQPSGSGYASISGSLYYYDVDVTGVGSVIDTVNYNWFYNTPGTFGPTPVNGSPSFLNLPTIPVGDTLDIQGFITFKVDPASINVETVPEPGTFLMAGLGLAGLLAIRRRRK